MQGHRAGVQVIGGMGVQGTGYGGYRVQGLQGTRVAGYEGYKVQGVQASRRKEDKGCKVQVVQGRLIQVQGTEVKWYMVHWYRVRIESGI